MHFVYSFYVFIIFLCSLCVVCVCVCFFCDALVFIEFVLLPCAICIDMMMMIARFMLWWDDCPSFCLSVRLSHCLVYCVETTELIIKQLALNCSTRILVYRHQTWNIYL